MFAATPVPLTTSPGASAMPGARTLTVSVVPLMEPVAVATCAAWMPRSPLMICAALEKLVAPERLTAPVLSEPSMVTYSVPL